MSKVKSRTGLIVRGKNSESHSPELMAQHADCILTTGEPYGFFGGDGTATGGGFSVSSNGSGMNMKGIVADYRTMKKIRPYYIDVKMAKKSDVVSTLIAIDATHEEGMLFDNFWKQLKLKPGAFNILGGNCSTHASQAFIAANIVSGGIPGLDTPNNLFIQLSKLTNRNIIIKTGYIGAKLNSSGRYAPDILPITKKTW